MAFFSSLTPDQITSLQVSGTPPANGGVAAVKNNDTAPTSPRVLSGYIDEATSDHIKGWVWDTAQPQERICIEIVLNDIQVAVVTAKDYRVDLEIAGIGDGRHAFFINLEPNLLLDRHVSVHLRCIDTGASVPGSPIVLEPVLLALAPTNIA